MPLHPLAVVTVVLFLFISPNLICYSHTARWLSLSLSLWPLLCFHSFVSHSQQQSGSSFDMSWCQCVHVSPHHLLSWFLLSFPVSVYNPFIELSRVYKCALIYAELMPKKTQVLFLFHYWGFCQTKNTEGKQEKSVLLFRSKSQGKRDRKQHKGGYDDIFHCDIVNCCSCVLNKLNHHHYLVAGVLHFLYTLRESWEQQDSLVGQEIPPSSESQRLQICFSCFIFLMRHNGSQCDSFTLHWLLGGHGLWEMWRRKDNKRLTVVLYFSCCGTLLAAHLCW